MLALISTKTLTLEAAMRVEDAARSLDRALAAVGRRPARALSLTPRGATALRMALDSALRKARTPGPLSLAGPTERLVFLLLLLEAWRWARAIHPPDVAAQLEFICGTVASPGDPARVAAEDLTESLSEFLGSPPDPTKGGRSMP